ncbi:MAG: hydroxymethylpyrimidine/phosphomethylpyrimidine kinase [Pseudomonadota bacterium]
MLLAAGLDPCAGAGILADARVAADHGVRAVGVVTALTVQDTVRAHSAAPVAATLVEDQLRVLLADVSIDAVKIGMLGSFQVADAVTRVLCESSSQIGAPPKGGCEPSPPPVGGDLRRVLPIVWDPVIAPSRGNARFLAGPQPRHDQEQESIAALLARCRIVTPNLSEAAFLAHHTAIECLAGMHRAAAAIVARGAAAALVKGGHLPGPVAMDVFFDGESVLELSESRIERGQPTHGTGCVLSSAIACGLALGKSTEDAVRSGKEYLTCKLREAIRVGRGASCLV